MRRAAPSPEVLARIKASLAPYEETSRKLAEIKGARAARKMAAQEAARSRVKGGTVRGTPPCICWTPPVAPVRIPPKAEAMKWVSRRSFTSGMMAGLLTVLVSDPASAIAFTADPDSRYAWLHGSVGGALPVTPPYNTPGPGTNYYAASAMNGGSNSNPGTITQPWSNDIAFITSAISALTGDITVNFHTGDTFQGPATGAGLSSPTTTTSCLFQGFPSLTQPIILAQFNGGSGIIITHANCSVYGLTVNGDTFSYGIVTAGSNVEISFCTIQDFSLPSSSTGGYCVSVNNTNVNIHDNTIGGLSPTDATGTGILLNILTGCSIKNNVIGNCGGMASNPLQTGFGIHTTDFTTATGLFTYSGGVPTNALIEIAFNIIHDCGGNFTNTNGGGNSGIECGNGNRQWVHDNIIYNIQSVVTFTGGTDFDPIDVGDTNGTTLAERNFCHDSWGGLIDFGDANSGPLIARYNLVVNCGVQNNIFAGAMQGEGTNSIHQFYGNTYVTMIQNGQPSPIMIFIGANLNAATGFFANNLVYAVFPWKIFDTDTGGLSATVLLTTNCWFTPVSQTNARFYDFQGGATYGSYAAVKAAQPLFDQNGVTGDPLLANAISAITWNSGAGGHMVVTTANPHGQTGTFQVTIDGNSYWNGITFSGTANGTFTATVTGASSFTYPFASDPTASGLASPGVWAVGATSWLNNPLAYKLGSPSSSCYRTGVNVATMFGVDAGATDFYGNPINPALASIGCHQP